ncbi:MAG TPA: PAS domain S-box protein [Bryobacteraceae bacterium]|nr:PAS domain S-box protein [Bryobacteraceae bacterium]
MFSPREPTIPGWSGLRWSELVVYTASLLVLVGGLSTFYGWLGGYPQLLCIAPSTPPVVLDAAVCFILSALGLVAAIDYRFVLLRNMGSLLILAGGFLVITQGIHIPRSIHYFLPPGVNAVISADRTVISMAPATATAFALFGCGLVLLSRPILRKQGLIGVATIATVMMSIGVTSLFGYAVGMHGNHSWQFFLRMPFWAAVYVCLLGVGICAIAWSRATAISHELVVAASALALFGLLLLFCGVDAAVFLGLNESLQDRAEIAALYRRIKAVAEEVAAVREAETGQRGYLLTNDPAYLDQYQGGVARIRELTQEGFDSSGSRAALLFQDRLSKKLDEVGRTIRLQQAGDSPGARALVETGEGQALMKQIEQQAKVLTAAYQAPLEHRLNAYQDAVLTIKKTVAVAYGIGFLLVTFAVLVVYKEIRRRGQIEQKLQENEILLEEKVRARTAALEQQTQALHIEIEARRRLELELRTADTRLNSALELAQVAVWTWNAAHELANAGNVVIWSGPVGEVFGREAPALNSYAALREMVHPEDRNWLDQKIATCLETGHVYEAEFRLIMPNGQVRWVAGKGAVSRVEDSSQLKMAGINFDITARKQAEEALKRSEARYRALLEQSPVAIHVLDSLGNTITVNPAFESHFGIKSEQMAGFNVWNDPQLDSNHVRGLLEQTYAGTVTSSGPLQHDLTVSVGHGLAPWIEVTAYPVKSKEGVVQEVVLMSQDVTQRELAQAAVRRSEQHFRELANAMPQIVWTASASGQLAYHNDRWYDFVGIDRSSDTALGWSTILHPDDLAECRRLWDEARLAESSFEMECRLWDRQHNQYRWYLCRALPVLNEQKNVDRWIGTCTDVHEQKAAKEVLEAEVGSRTAALEQALGEKNTLLKEVHHRVKNNLQVICSLLRLQANLLKDEVATAALRESQQRVLSMALIHERLYGNAKMDRIDFGEYTAALAQELSYSYSLGTHNVATRLDLSPVQLKIDQAVPCGLILNELITNALKYAHPEGRRGEIRIMLKQMATGEVALTVSDDGIGLPVDFDQRKSKSLGMTIVQILAKQLGAAFTVQSQPGASFTLCFPNQCSDQRAVALNQLARGSAATGSAGLIRG